MSRFNCRASRRPIRSLLIAALLLGCAASAQADVRLYTGSLIIEAFANTTTNGTAPPFTDSTVVGIPLTGMCNTVTFHPQETLIFSNGTTMKPSPRRAPRPSFPTPRRQA